MSILLFLFAKTPLIVVLCAAAILALLIHPVWNFWWVEMYRGRQIFFTVILAICCCLLIGYAAWPEKPTPDIAQPYTPTSTPALATENTPKVSASSAEERIFLDVKPEYLLRFFTKFNSAQAQKFVEPYIGKWMEISGHVYAQRSKGVLRGQPDPGPIISITTKRKNRKDDYGAYCRFEEQRWKDLVLVLRRGETVTLRGRITLIYGRRFWLEKYEFVK